MKRLGFIAILLITCFFTKLYASERNAIHGEIISYEATDVSDGLYYLIIRDNNKIIRTEKLIKF